MDTPTVIQNGLSPNTLALVSTIVGSVSASIIAVCTAYNNYLASKHKAITEQVSASTNVQTTGGK